MTRTISLRTVIITATLVAFVALPFLASANNQCAFSRTLSVGDTGEEVRCLQVFLNGAGFVIAQTGAGSVGSETTQFGSMTEAAVLKWQEAKLVPGANGVFGPGSQAAYLIAVVTALEAQQVAQAPAKATTPTPVVAGVSTSVASETKAALVAAVAMVRDAEEQVIDEDDVDERAELEADLRDVREDLYEALLAYLNGDYDEGLNLATDILDDATDVLEGAGGESERTKAEDLMEDVEDLLDDVQELFDEAEDNDARVGDAEDLIGDAKDLLRDANNAFDNGIYRQARSDALDAEELLEAAQDEIEVFSKRDVERALEKMWDEYRDADDEVDDADDDNNRGADDARDLLDDAKYRLQDADDAFEDEDYAEVMELVEEAEELIEEALDEL
jgi:peptidoglycan hydrolase-like protein with peptidoglycan-binding domain/cellobiose-specific phosphotransferase system component IIA